MKTKSAKKTARKARAKTATKQVVEGVEISEVAEISEKPTKRKTRAKTVKPEGDTVQALDPRFNRRSDVGKSLLPAKELTVREFGDNMTPEKACFVIACSLLQKRERFTEQEFAGVIAKHTRKSLEQVRATQPKAYPDGKIHRGLYALVSGSLQTGMKLDKKTGKMRPQWARGSLKCLAKTPRVGWAFGEYAMHPELRKTRGTAYPKPSSELLKSACETLV